MVGAQCVHCRAGATLTDRRRRHAVKKTPLDALPDLSDVQVIVYTPYAGQAPKVVEDQITYPLTTAMLAVPKPGRARLLDVWRLLCLRDFRRWHRHLLGPFRGARISQRRPGQLAGWRQPATRADATGVGWVFQYALTGRTSRWLICAVFGTGTSATS